MRLARELSWASHKLLEVAKVLSRLEAELTKHAHSASMNAVRPNEGSQEARDAGGPGGVPEAEPFQVPLRFEL